MESFKVSAQDLVIGDRIKVPSIILGRRDRYNLDYETTVTSVERRATGSVHVRCIGGQFTVLSDLEFTRVFNGACDTVAVVIPKMVRSKGRSVD